MLSSRLSSVVLVVLAVLCIESAARADGCQGAPFLDVPAATGGSGPPCPPEAIFIPEATICRFTPDPQSFEYTIQLIENDTSSQGRYLAEVEPNIPTMPIHGLIRPGNGARSKTSLRAKVTCSGSPASGVPVQIEAKIKPYTGGHAHNGPVHKATINPAIVSTGPDGFLDYVFTAGVASGEYELEAKCTNAAANCSSAFGRIKVGVKDLIQLYNPHVYG